jgi:hypothetical protein
MSLADSGSVSSPALPSPPLGVPISAWLFCHVCLSSVLNPNLPGLLTQPWSDKCPVLCKGLIFMKSTLVLEVKI